MTNLYSPLSSLEQGCWFKLICGASFQHLPSVRNLTLAYALAGSDCIDVAADPAAIAAAQAALEVANAWEDKAQQKGFGRGGKSSPWLMVSLNDGEDPHFRKAEFNQAECPAGCPRPCEKICPAQAISFNDSSSGVMADLCYGCGRCLPICPNQLIYTRSYVSTPQAIAPLVLSNGVDAVEIHTQVGRLTAFERLWKSIVPWADQLKIVAISCPDGDGLTNYLWSLYELISPLKCPLIWQTDGRPMSGDIGDGTTRAAIKLGQKVLAARLPGHVQLAGGTNSHTVEKLRALKLLKEDTEKTSPPHPLTPSPPPLISGVAYGSYARVLLAPILTAIETEVNQSGAIATMRLEERPDLLWQAVELAHSLVSQIKFSQDSSLALLTSRSLKKTLI